MFDNKSWTILTSLVSMAEKSGGVLIKIEILFNILISNGIEKVNKFHWNIIF